MSVKCENNQIDFGQQNETTRRVKEVQKIYVGVRQGREHAVWAAWEIR